MIARYTRPRMGAIWSEQHKFETWLRVELLACEAQHRLGRIPAGDLKIIQEKAGFDIARIGQIEAEVQHDVIAFLTAVGERVGPSARYIHLGMTSSDVLDTSWAVLLKEAGAELLAGLDRLAAVLRQRAVEFKRVPMMGRSHGIHAEPTTFGLKLALWWQECLRNRERLQRAVESVSCGKISGAVGTFAHIDPAVEEHVCRELGLAPEPVSTQVVQRDRHAEFLCVLALASASIEKIALEVRHLQRTEVREAEEPFSAKQKGSSAMPHKRNPIVCERLCGLARLVRANAQAGLENVALWHERDISHSSAERVIIPDSAILLDYMLDKAEWLVRGMRVHPERMMANLEVSGGLFFSQGLLLALVESGLSREEAYGIVQGLSLEVWEKGGSLRKRAGEEPGITKRLSPETLDGIFDLKHYLGKVDHIFQRIGL